MSEQNEGARRRSAAEIEADNAALREEMRRTVDELADRVDPRTHAAAAAHRAQEVATEAVEVAKERSTAFVDDVRSGQPKALAIAAGAVAALAGVIAISLRKK